MRLSTHRKYCSYQKSLIALRRIGNSVEEVWDLQPGSRLATNIAVKEERNGTFTFGAVTEDGMLLFWE